MDERGSGLRHYPADTHLFDWLEACGYRFDVVTDEDLHREGPDLIAPYRAVLTTSHPEYHTARTLDALERFLAGGGRLMYLGGNGFYWRVALHDDVPGAVEIRRAEGGIRAWAAEPGEYYNAFDGRYGGLWRRNDRPPQRLAGVGVLGAGTVRRLVLRAGPGSRRSARGVDLRRGSRIGFSATSACPAAGRRASSSTAWTTDSGRPPTP